MTEILWKLEPVGGFVLLNVSHALLKLITLASPVNGIRFDPSFVKVESIDDQIEPAFLVRDKLDCR